jgi:Fe-S cluster assembly protein SufD
MIDTLNQTKAGRKSERAEIMSAVPNGENGEISLRAFSRAAHPAWLQSIVDDAGTKLDGELRFPTSDDEEWRFTNMSAIRQLPVHPARQRNVELTQEEIAPFVFDLDWYRLVFVDGYFCASLSVLPGERADLQVRPLSVQLKSDARILEGKLVHAGSTAPNFFTALNAAFFQEGAFVSIAAGKTADKPVHLLFIGTAQEEGATIQPRNLILGGAGSELKIIESYVSFSDAARLTNTVTEVFIDADARVDHCKLQQESERAYHVGTTLGVQGKGSHWTSHSIATGGRIARNQIETVFRAERSECILNGLYLAHGEQLIDHHTVVDHAKPLCESHEFYHGILADRARGVFNGKIFVRQDAQKTNAKQTNRNLLLSDTAMVDTKPQLEIYADDVKCTHGATVGQLNEDSIFYLRSRGIGLEKARRMLVEAFASDVVGRITLEPVRAKLEELLAARFEQLKV